MPRVAAGASTECNPSLEALLGRLLPQERGSGSAQRQPIVVRLETGIWIAAIQHVVCLPWQDGSMKCCTLHIVIASLEMPAPASAEAVDSMTQNSVPDPREAQLLEQLAGKLGVVECHGLWMIALESSRGGRY